MRYKPATVAHLFTLFNLGLIMVAIYFPAAFLAFWFFSIVIAFVLAYYLLASGMSRSRCPLHPVDGHPFHTYLLYLG